MDAGDGQMDGAGWTPLLGSRPADPADAMADLGPEQPTYADGHLAGARVRHHGAFRHAQHLELHVHVGGDDRSAEPP
jgi:hypothetical protein